MTPDNPLELTCEPVCYNQLTPKPFFVVCHVVANVGESAFSELLYRPRVNWTGDGKRSAHSKPIIGQTSESEQIVEVLPCAEDANDLEDGFVIVREDAVEEQGALIDRERTYGYRVKSPSRGATKEAVRCV